jgi:hypothetical protein
MTIFVRHANGSRRGVDVMFQIVSANGGREKPRQGDPWTTIAWNPQLHVANLCTDTALPAPCDTHDPHLSRRHTALIPRPFLSAPPTIPPK